MRRRHMPLMVLVLVLAAAGVPAAAAGQAQLNGRYTYNAQASDDIPQAINTALRSMNFVIRPMVRRHMNRNERPFQWVGIHFDAAQVSITTDRTSSAITSRIDGTPVPRPRDDGEVQYFSTRWANGRLEQIIRAPEARRTTTYSLSPDGNTLTMAIRLAAPRLPQPVAYRLVYDRVQ